MRSTEILTKLELEPGRYQLRFAAHSASLNKSGSVFQDIEIPDFTEGGAVALGARPRRDPSLASAPRTSSPPSSRSRRRPSGHS